MPQSIVKSYLKLRRSRSMGKIDQSQFLEEVNKLSIQDENGIYWRVEPKNGDLLSWDGTNWNKANESNHLNSSQLGDSNQGNDNKKKVEPTQLDGVIGISWFPLIKQIAFSIFSRIKLMLFVGVAAFLLHTFLIAVGNNGYNKNTPISDMFYNLRAYSPRLFSGWISSAVRWTIGNFQVGSNIAIVGNRVPATAGWTFGGAMLLMAWRGFRRRGLFSSIRRMFVMPKRVVNACGPNIGLNLLGLAVGVVFASFFSSLLPQQSQNMLSFISLGMVGSILPMAFGSILARLANMLIRSFKMKFLRKIKFTGLGQVIFLGLSAGMFTKSCWQYGPILGWALGIYTVFLVVTRSNKARPVSGRVATFFSITALTGVLITLSEHALFAHDKGWWENVNQNDPLLTQISSWIHADGSAELMKAGVPPAVGAAVGAGAADAATKVTVYVLQVSTHFLEVSPDSPAELVVSVWKSTEDGGLVPANDASISISAMGGSWITLSQTSGAGKVICLVGQSPESVSGSELPQPVTLTVTGSGGKQSSTSTVTVTPGGAPQFILEVF